MDPDVEGGEAPADAEMEVAALRESIKNALTAHGTLGQARAMMKASSYSILKASSAENHQRVKQRAVSEDVLLGYAIVEDFLASQGLKYSLGVFQSETSEHPTQQNRDGLATDLHVSPDQPILLSLIQGGGNRGTGLAGGGMSSSEVSPKSAGSPTSYTQDEDIIEDELGGDPELEPSASRQRDAQQEAAAAEAEEEEEEESVHSFEWTEESGRVPHVEYDEVDRIIKVQDATVESEEDDDSF